MPDFLNAQNPIIPRNFKLMKTSNFQQINLTAIFPLQNPKLFHVEQSPKCPLFQSLLHSLFHKMFRGSPTEISTEYTSPQGRAHPAATIGPRGTICISGAARIKSAEHFHVEKSSLPAQPGSRVRSTHNRPLIPFWA
jgi:hypothetical protein